MRTAGARLWLHRPRKRARGLVEAGAIERGTATPGLAARAARRRTYCRRYARAPAAADPSCPRRTGRSAQCSTSRRGQHECHRARRAAHRRPRDGRQQRPRCRGRGAASAPRSGAGRRRRPRSTTRRCPPRKSEGAAITRSASRRMRASRPAGVASTTSPANATARQRRPEEEAMRRRGRGPPARGAQSTYIFRATRRDGPTWPLSAR